MSSDPIEIFKDLFARASKLCDEPDATVLSTVDADGQPSGRFVLLKAGSFSIRISVAARRGR